MKLLFILAGVAALAAAAPVAAKPNHGHGNNQSHQNFGYGQGNCPPGLAKKNNGCLPPGQFKKRFERGQRFNTSYGERYAYNRLPYNLRDQYDLDRSNRYYYDQGYLYQVDPRTMLVERVIRTLLGR